MKCVSGFQDLRRSMSAPTARRYRPARCRNHVIRHVLKNKAVFLFCRLLKNTVQHLLHADLTAFPYFWTQPQTPQSRRQPVGFAPCHAYRRAARRKTLRRCPQLWGGACYVLNDLACREYEPKLAGSVLSMTRVSVKTILQLIVWTRNSTYENTLPH